MSEGRDYEDESSADAMTRADSHGEGKTSACATIALAIPWCPWVPERVESMARLRAALGYADDEGDGNALIRDRADAEPIEVAEFRERMPNDQWSDAVFNWLAGEAEEGIDWCLQIQEDAIVPPNFWPALRALLEGLPDDADIVGLHVCHPIASALAQEGHRLFTTADALVGVMWAVRGSVMREFVEWRRTQLADGWRDPVPPRGAPGLTEDTMIGLFAMSTGRKVYHPIPTLVDHDTGVASVYGNDDHTNRRPKVSWKDAAKFRDEHGPWWDDEILEAPGFWMGRCRTVQSYAPDGSSLGKAIATSSNPQVLTGRAPIPHVGRFYEHSPMMARRWVLGFGDLQYRKAMADSGEREKRRLYHARHARGFGDSGKRIMIATPSRGHVDPQYTTSLVRLSQIADVAFDFEITGVQIASQDLVRVRSRLVRQFLDGDATHLLFLDADVVCSPVTVMGLLRADRGIVGAPYPRRGIVDFDGMRQAIADEDERPLEAHAFDYAVRPLDGAQDFETDALGCVEVTSIPLGCTMLARPLLERMVDHYGPELTFLDIAIEQQGSAHPTVALFQLMIRNHVLLGEDTSFCARARDIGEKVFLYLGQGSPVDHVGDLTFTGNLEAFGLKRPRAA